MFLSLILKDKGLFANRDFKINDVILKKAFPYNLNKRALLNGRVDKFNKYISAMKEQK